MKNILVLLLLLLTGLMSFKVRANEFRPPLDVAYDNLIHPEVDDLFNKAEGFSDTHGLIEWQTPVKSQGQRGTCSIFSAIAMLEFQMRSKFNMAKDYDLSEQYLEYVVARGKKVDGSNSWNNFEGIVKHGVVLENILPYNPTNWVVDTHKATRCQHLDKNSLNYQSCLVVQWDPRLFSFDIEDLLIENSQTYAPNLAAAREKGIEFKNQFIASKRRRFRVYNTTDIKNLLRSGEPLTMGITLYYGSWNHGVGRDYDIPMNFDNWHKGIVSYPEKGSIDFINSQKARAGHSILIVGFDDSKEIEVQVKMADGTSRTKTYRGVYYFKNSWGTSSFGKDFKIDGKSYPGYGMITQKYANEYGSFYHLDL